jgi:electron transport complex protein RnfG
MPDGTLRKWLPALISGLVLSVFAVIGTTLVGISYQSTAERIAQNERDALLRRMAEILPADRYDNDLLLDTSELLAPAHLGSRPTTVYRARKEGRPVAAVLSPVTASGYAGDIALIVGIYADGTVAGVRVIRHKETPGLGDKIEVERSPWIRGLSGTSIGNPPLARWKVKRDGGDFDQFTGATITPRAVVAAVRRTLLYVNNNRAAVFGKTAEAPPAPDGPAAQAQEQAHG